MSINLASVLAQRAAISPELEAYVEPDANIRLSYRQLNAQANRFASFFGRRGVSRGDRVAVLLPNSAAFIASFYGAAKLGAIVVPLNTRLAAAELAFILADSGSSVLLHSADFSETVAAIRSQQDHPLTVEHWLCADDTLLALVSEESAAEPEKQAAGDHDLFIMYTSGTTGLPKGVVHTHSSINWSASSWVTTMDVRYRDRLWLPLPMFHVAALTTVVTCALRGMSIVSQPNFDPMAAWPMIRDERVNLGGAVPAILNFMRQVPDFQTFESPHFRAFITGAAPMPKALIELYAEKDIQVIQGYALTESGGGGTFLLADDSMRKAGSAGKPAMYAEIAVRNNQGTLSAKGEGEVVMRAPFLMKEYWNRPEDTRSAFDNGWFLTGDIADIDDEGFVFIKDRIKDMIISGGENIYPAEIENVIISHEGVAEVAVIGLPDEKWGEVACAIVVSTDASLSEEDIIGICEERLSRYKLPRKVVFTDVIPRNPAGKILKRVLRDQYND
jgi:acyl-CoA synthetase (AMP-forming)/AMP-acid ligase II